MTDAVQSPTLIGVPLVAHLILWPALIGWAIVLARARRERPWLRSGRLGFALVWSAALADAATLQAQHAQPTADTLVFTLLWTAVLLSVSAYLVLRAGEDGEEGGSVIEPPEPPWWPGFERQFREYARSRPPAGRPRSPAARG